VASLETVSDGGPGPVRTRHGPDQPQPVARRVAGVAV